MWQRRFIVACSVWIIFFEAPDPRQLFEWVVGSGYHNPQYLFAESEREVCRRVRRVVDRGQVNIYVENLSSHKSHIELPPYKLRKLISMCSHGYAK